MNEKLKKMIGYMLRHHIIGAKHLPEDILIKHAIQYLDKSSQKEFYSEYHELLNQEYIIKLKKQTGKGSDWHISLNPEMIEKIDELLEVHDEVR
jgi:hypothetical protein